MQPEVSLPCSQEFIISTFKCAISFSSNLRLDFLSDQGTQQKFWTFFIYHIRNEHYTSEK
jgi:hypothetical protein